MSVCVGGEVGAVSVWKGRGVIDGVDLLFTVELCIKSGRQTHSYTHTHTHTRTHTHTYTHTHVHTVLSSPVSKLK